MNQELVEFVKRRPILTLLTIIITAFTDLLLLLLFKLSNWWHETPVNPYYDLSCYHLGRGTGLLISRTNAPIEDAHDVVEDTVNKLCD